MYKQQTSMTKNLKQRTKQIMDWYMVNGRHDLPWRHDLRPYSILVSELMLQQTQVDRVRPKYLHFMKKFPDEIALSQAKLGDVLISWQGLGYNRRAKYLLQTAREVEKLGSFPKTLDELLLLPGIGPYTAGAILAFAYNQPVVMIETNIRSVFLHHFFPDQIKVSDTELLPLIEASVDKNNPRSWYWALMDYGSFLKSQVKNPSQRSKQYSKQSKFAGSRRELRGKIIEMLTTKLIVSKSELASEFSTRSDYEQVIADLVKEELVRENTDTYSI